MNETLTVEQCANFLGTLDIERLRKLAKKMNLAADQRARASVIEALAAVPQRTLVEALTQGELRAFSGAVGSARTGAKTIRFTLVHWLLTATVMAAGGCGATVGPHTSPDSSSVDATGVPDSSDHDARCVIAARPIRCGEGDRDNLCLNWARSQFTNATPYVVCGFRDTITMCMTGDRCETSPGNPGTEQGPVTTCTCGGVQCLAPSICVTTSGSPPRCAQPCSL